NAKQWMKLGNSLMLRLAMRVRFAAPELSKKYAEQAANDRAMEQSSDKEKEKDWPQPTVITKKQYKFDGAGFLSEEGQYQVRYLQLEEMLAWQSETLPTDRRPDTELVMALDHSFSLEFADDACLLYTDHTDPQDEWCQEEVIYRYDRAEGSSRILVPAGAEESVSLLGLSPNHECCIIAIKDRRYGYLTYPHIFAYQLQSGKSRLLNEGLEIDPGDSLVADFQQQTRPVEVLWLDETQFLLLASEHGKTVLYRGDTGGRMGKVIDRRFHLTGAVLADEDRLLITYSTLTVPSRLAMLRLSTGEVRDLYDPNQQFCREHRMVEPEMFYFKGYDNWEIQAWYLTPITDEGRYPAILYIHGGPQVAYGESFFHEMQALAAAGYGVMMINPRGGSSYGQRFVASILGDYGNHDYDDLMIGVDEMLKRYPAIDPARLFVVGGSYGGFMTNWIVTHTDRFRAAVTQRSISNWLSFYGTSDIGADFVKWQLQHELPDAKRLWELSPLAYAEQAKTPLLVLHSDEDHRCPKEQGEQMYMAMKRYGVETKMITFPKSGHGLSRTGLPNLRQQRLAAIRDWFDAHGGCNNTQEGKE
ncbi:MAG: prolyl oligopeptidase family serine peptidase, partial [Lachnospiraceae bacterium]|nr:prolyl oligopeptidase family serine peptidase [Lachnospiraceae bacterium]